MPNDSGNLRYLIDSYKDWMASERIPIAEGIAVDLHRVETAPWPRLGGGVRGAFVQLRGRGDFVGLHVIDIPPGGATEWARHLFDEVMDSGAVSHVRFNIFPDGGVSRLRVYGEVE